MKKFKTIIKIPPDKILDPYSIELIYKLNLIFSTIGRKNLPIVEKNLATSLMRIVLNM